MLTFPLKNTIIITNIMRKFIFSLTLATFLVVVFFAFQPVFAQTEASIGYLCEIAVDFYRKGRYEDALSEFKKVLLLDPNNPTAKAYINVIFKPEVSVAQATQKTQTPPKQAPLAPQEKISREEIINSTLDSVSKKDAVQKEFGKNPLEAAGINITGEAQVRVGMTSSDAIWKRANWDMNEKNYRTLSTTAYDRKENTYDPRVYDRLRVNLDTNNEEGLGFHTNIIVDPWSFTGKTSKFVIQGTGGDAADIELKYWSNTGYTINENVNTLYNGDSFSLPEIKVVDGKISIPSSVRSAYNNTFTLPESKIYYEFQPLREMWLDYAQDDLKLRVYPIAYENQALTFDDPLKLSNNRIWWEDSPWLHGWKHGNFNSGATPVDFTKGYWDNSLSFFTRDSEGQRLTALRGFSFQFNPLEETSIQTSVASPKTLWQDYSEIDNFLSATRIKHSLLENLTLGITANTRLGYNVDNENKLDAKNYVFGADISYEIIDGLKTSFEFVNSQSQYDITNSTYLSKLNGNAYHLSLMARFPFESIIKTEYGYDGIQPEEWESSFTKFRLFATRMDDNFDNSLSSYVETRDDEWWGRHLHFRKPFQHYYQGEGQLLGWDNIKSYAIGNGVDYGRSVLGLRVESFFWDKALTNLFDVRNVHSTKNKFIENVARDELTWSINEKLTSKFLGIYQKLPKTKGGYDPFIFDPVSRRYFTNTYIEDGMNPSITTGSAGAEYAFFDWLALNGIWESTNDVSLAYDNFPRGIFNTASRSFISSDENNNRYRSILDSLYNQQYFPKPPYPYYNIFKAGLRLNPLEKVNIYLDYTRNPFEKAGQVDDNINHIGLELSYAPAAKFAMFFKYTYSRWQDLDKLQQGITELLGHHNFFSEFVYRKSQDEDLTFQYGEASRNPYMGGVLDIGWDPYGGSLRTVDTQHIFRLYYRKKF